MTMQSVQKHSSLYRLSSSPALRRGGGSGGEERWDVIAAKPGKKSCQVQDTSSCALQIPGHETRLRTCFYSTSPAWEQANGQCSEMLPTESARSVFGGRRSRTIPRKVSWPIFRVRLLSWHIREAGFWCLGLDRKRVLQPLARGGNPILVCGRHQLVGVALDRALEHGLLTAHKSRQ